jgi:hypothetical protein
MYCRYLCCHLSLQGSWGNRQSTPQTRVTHSSQQCNCKSYVHTYYVHNAPKHYAHILILMLAHTACNVLNTMQGLEYIKELWPSIIRIMYIFSTIHLPICIQIKQTWIHLPQHNPFTQPTLATHRFFVENRKLHQLF